MKNAFTIPAPIDEAWRVLLDIERVAPCMPGAKLESANGDQFEGSVKVKLGAMVLTYRGQARIVEQDEAAHRAVIEGSAKETRGAGTAKANVITTLRPRGDETEVEVVTELHVTGKPAQFGRGVMGEVAERLIGQFSDRLSEEMTSGGVSAPAAAPDAGDAAPPQETRRPIAAPRESDEPIDLLAVAGGPVAKRAAGAAAAGVALMVLVRAFTGGGRRRGAPGLARGVTVLCSCGHESTLV